MIKTKKVQKAKTGQKMGGWGLQLRRIVACPMTRMLWFSMLIVHGGASLINLLELDLPQVSLGSCGDGSLLVMAVIRET